MIRKVIILGSGSAGLIAALSLKRKLPVLDVEIVRDPDIGVIGVGEGTTPGFVRHMFDFLGFKRKRFYELAKPTWKLGIRFQWGPRGRFDYAFDPQLDRQDPRLKLPNGFYCEETFANVNLAGALMRSDKVFERQPSKAPNVQDWHAFHIENHNLVEALEIEAREARVKITDGKFTHAEQGSGGISAIHLADGRRMEADLFVDASGFAAELIGKTLEEPLGDFRKTLFCDRAVVGGWERGDDEPILPYTTAETMGTGWSWRIDHEYHVNRGYVYASDMISDDEAAEEFRRRNPKVSESPRVVRFRSGCRRRQWVDNVVAIGNAAGFVEPLEATALMVVCADCHVLVDFLRHSQCHPTPTIRRFYNTTRRERWENIRDFLGIHYRFNTADNTPFWERCRRETDLSGIAEFLEFYEENGPSGIGGHLIPGVVNDFGVEGFLVMLVGMNAPYRNRYEPSRQELKEWNQRRTLLAKQANKGIGVKEALGYVMDSRWSWHGDS